MKQLLIASILVAATSSAHATPQLAVGGSMGGETVTATDLLFFVPLGERTTTMAVAQLHVGARSLDGWVEPGVDFELGRGDGGIQSSATFVDLRGHLFPHWRVHPTLLLGVGAETAHGTGAMDVQTGARPAVLIGIGAEVRIDSSWSANVELRSALVGGGSGDLDSSSSRADYVAIGLLGEKSVNAGVIYRF